MSEHANSEPKLTRKKISQILWHSGIGITLMSLLWFAFLYAEVNPKAVPLLTGECDTEFNWQTWQREPCVNGKTWWKNLNNEATE